MCVCARVCVGLNLRHTVFPQNVHFHTEHFVLILDGDYGLQALPKQSG